jgi:hypothetical protein
VDFNLHYIAGMMGIQQNDSGIISPCWGYKILSALASESELPVTTLQQQVRIKLQTPWCSMTLSKSVDTKGLEIVEEGKKQDYNRQKNPDQKYVLVCGGEFLDLNETVVELIKKYPNEWELKKV